MEVFSQQNVKVIISKMYMNALGRIVHVFQIKKSKKRPFDVARARTIVEFG